MGVKYNHTTVPPIVSATDSASVDFTVAGTDITAVVLPAGVNHDSLNGFVANEHIDHSSVTIGPAASLSGLTGGGDITASRTLSVDIEQLFNNSSAIVAASDLIAWKDVSSGRNSYKTYQTFMNDLSSLSTTASTAFTDTIPILASGTTAELITRANLITPRTAWVTGNTAVNTWNNTTETTYASWNTSTAFSQSLDTSALTVSANGIFTVARGYYLVEIYVQGTGTANNTTPLFGFSEDVDAIASSPLVVVPKNNADENSSAVDGWGGSASIVTRLNNNNQYTIKGIRNHGTGTFTTSKIAMRMTLLQEV